ncbi:spore gernimation protein [Orenia metallireducens]|uniref:Spore gernimation protein n=1 Tax=Orenia metallireducens TaxID=1413210 RepID=A0A1C0ACS2_9FIRM|nr:endospore germination permease [Orenia metallireducens]OCL28427.1 spore gernimation protein [Orenia metallireducens]
MIKINKEGKVTERQFSAIIINTILGVGILTLPRVAVSFADNAGIISVVLASVLSLINLTIIIKLGLRFPNKTIFEYLQIILGKIMGKIIGLFIICYWFIFIALVIRTFSELIVTAVLPKTPIEVVIIIMLLLVAYLSYKDIQVLARVNELYVFIVIIPILFLTILSFKRGHMVYVLPVFRGHSMINILKSAGRSYFSFLGFEVVAIILPFITTRKLSLEYGIKGWLIPSVVSVVVVIASISVFGVFELKNLVWPTFELIKSTQFFALIFERLEVAFIATWVIALFTTASNLLFGIAMGGAQILSLHKHKTLVFFLLPLLYLLALSPRNAYELFNLVDIISIVGLILTTILPIMLLILVQVKGKGGKRVDEESI